MKLFSSRDPACFSYCQETLNTSDKAKITTEEISQNVKGNNDVYLGPKLFITMSLNTFCEG